MINSTSALMLIAQSDHHCMHDREVHTKQWRMVLQVPLKLNVILE